MKKIHSSNVFESGTTNCEEKSMYIDTFVLTAYILCHDYYLAFNLKSITENQLDATDNNESKNGIALIFKTDRLMATIVSGF